MPSSPSRAVDLVGLGVLACPDDAGPLTESNGGLQCKTCSRNFPIFEGRVVELLPTNPSSEVLGNDLYAKSYRDSRAEAYVTGEQMAPWADPSRLDQRSLEKKAQHTRWVLPRLLAGAGGSDLILCDISAGPGYYTLEYAQSFRYVLHCDLSAQALSYALGKANDRGLDNVLFLRIDYLRPPFSRSLDRIICFDTLIRGQEHERALLRSVAGSLSSEGLALVDFHNWWHNPIRRVGLLPDNFVGNTSYTRSQVVSLLRASRVSGELQGYHEEFDPGAWYAPLLARLLPPTRHSVAIRGDS